jgi:hypothetical protein
VPAALPHFNQPANVKWIADLAAKFLRDKCSEAVAQAGGRLADRAYALALENGYQNSGRWDE